jgi:hypothetical protein
MKKIIIALIVCTMLIPVIATAGYSFGFGGRIDPVSGGLEFRAFIPIKGQTAWFVAPHGIGIFTSDDNNRDILYSAGLRTGLVFVQDDWLSPFVGIGGGSTGQIYNDEKNLAFGGRIFVGLSVSPLQIFIRDEERAYESGRFKMDLDTGFFYRMYVSSLNHGTFEDTRTSYWFPDIGFGLSFNW